LVLLLIGSFAGTGYFLYTKSQKPPEVFETDSPFFTDIISKSVATGTITPRQQIDVKSQVSGVVETLYKLPGEIVAAGDLIAKIKIIPNVVNLNNAEARIQTASINFKNAEQELNRQKNLYETKVISQVEYNRFLLDYNLTKQELEAAESNLELIKEGASKKSGNVSNLVRATSSGMILDIPIKKGSFVIESNTFNDGTTIATIANMNDLIFEGFVDEAEVGKIREGMNLQLNVGALDTINFSATLEYISPKGVEKEGAIQFQIRASVELREGVFLRAGYSANADIVLQQKENVLAINEGQLLFDSGKTFVEIMKTDQEFEKKEIKTGISDGIKIEVVSGLSVDDKVKKLKG
jgi:HlyD family secretion protein